jgi:hypothetical protein
MPSVARGTARTLANEMHSSYEPVTPSLAMAEELNRLEAIWTYALHVTGVDTSWLCGNHSIADTIFAPMAVRLANYGFDTPPETQAYVAAHLADPARPRRIAGHSDQRGQGRERNRPSLRQPRHPPDATGRPHLRLLQRLLPGQSRRRPAAWPVFMTLLQPRSPAFIW